MPLLNLRPKSRKKRKIVGRGNSSGHGNYSGRGMKGQKQRSGGRIRRGFEGGQTPYYKRMPKRKGFTNPFPKKYQIINTGQLNIFEDGSIIKKEDLLARNLISKKNLPIKLLGGKGELEKKLTIYVDKASASAILKVEAKKGKVELSKPKEPKSTEPAKTSPKPDSSKPEAKPEAKPEKKSPELSHKPDFSKLEKPAEEKKVEKKPKKKENKVKDSKK